MRQALDPVYTVPDPSGRDMKLNSLKTSVALKCIGLDNLITTNHRKSGKNKYDRKVTEPDVVTTRILYRVNGALGCFHTVKFSVTNFASCRM